jgi:DHA1 family multidrug resistance protein-like MFS transporter
MKNNRKMLIILFITMVISNIGFGIIIPILPFYVEDMGVSASGIGAMIAIYSVMQLIFAPIFGSLSDRYGRKWILATGIFGNGLSLIIFGLANQLWMLYAARAFGGILSAATLPTAMAYIGDTTSDENRGGGMGIIGAAIGMGMVLGPGIGGWLASSSLSIPFIVAGSASIVATLVILFALPESLPIERRVKAGSIQHNPQYKKMLVAIGGSIGFLFFLAFLVSFGLTSFESVFTLYLEHRFQYGPKTVGTVLTVVGLLSAIVQGALTGPITRKWGEIRVIQVSLVCSAFGFAIVLFAFDLTSVLITVSFLILSNTMLRPAISSLISRQAGSEQGSAMGLNNAFMSLGRTIGPLWAGFLFDIHLNLPFISGIIIFLLIFVYSFWIFRSQLKTSTPEIISNP